MMGLSIPGKTGFETGPWICLSAHWSDDALIWRGISVQICLTCIEIPIIKIRRSHFYDGTLHTRKDGLWDGALDLPICALIWRRMKSAAMVLSWFGRNIPVSAPESLIQVLKYKGTVWLFYLDTLHAESRELLPICLEIGLLYDVIMAAIASQITGISIVCSTICSDADQRKHLNSAPMAFVRGIHRWPSQRASNAENVSIWWRHHVNDSSTWIGRRFNSSIKDDRNLVISYKHFLGCWWLGTAGNQDISIVVVEYISFPTWKT